LLVTGGLYAQSEADYGSPNFSRFQLGMNFSPHLAFRTLEIVDSYLNALYISFRDNERAKIGNTTGLVKPLLVC